MEDTKHPSGLQYCGTCGVEMTGGHFPNCPDYLSLLHENERLRFLLTALLEGKTNLHPNDVTAIRAALRGEG